MEQKETFNLLGEIKKGWHETGRQFKILGDSIEVKGQKWTPIKYLNEEDPTFIKTEAVKILGKVEPNTEEHCDHDWIDYGPTGLCCKACGKWFD